VSKEWKEVGVGLLTIAKVQDKFQLILRRDKVLKVPINHRIDETIKLDDLET
jgi:hypothetical protein